MKAFLAVCCAVMMVVACADTDTAEDTALPAADTAAVSDTTPAAAAPPDPDLQTIDATLTEWSVALSQDSVPAGVVAIRVRNGGTAPHALEVEGGGEEFKSDPLSAGEEVTMSLSLTAGTYEVYCPVDTAGVNHKARGMTTPLRVY